MNLPVSTLAEAKLVLDRERAELDPVHGQDQKLYIDRPANTYDDLIAEANTAVQSNRPFRWFFTGHTGAGKSTELNRITSGEELNRYYIPHIYRVKDNLDVHNLDFTDFILGMAHGVIEIAGERKIAIPKALITRIKKWGAEIEIETELSAGATATIGTELDFFFGKVTGEVQAGGEKREVIREKLRDCLTDFIRLIDDLVAVIEKKSERKVLIVLDTLDHVDLNPICDIFTKHWASISKPALSLLIVVPLPLILEKDFMGAVQDNYSLLPNIKVFNGPADRSIHPDGFAFFTDVISRLASLSLFAPGTLEQIFVLSGGMIRDMIGIAGDACKYADHPTDNPSGIVQPEHVETVLNQRKAYFRRLLRKADYTILREIAASPYPFGIDDIGPLLHLKAIIFFPNGEGWYGLNPAVQAMLDVPGA